MAFGVRDARRRFDALAVRARPIWDMHKRTRHGFFHFGIETMPSEWPSPLTWPLVCATPEDGLMRSLFGHVRSGTCRNARVTVFFILGLKPCHPSGLRP